LHARIAAGEWVVDLRSRKAFAHRHLAGTLSFGLDGPMSTWLGWMAPWGAPITLLGETAGRAGHLADAVHIPLPDLPARLGEVPAGTVWVHCGSGYRAAAATSLLQRAGRRVVHIDDAYAKAAAAGLTIVNGEEIR